MFGSRRISHINARYIRDRLIEMAYQKRHPDQPWLTPHACKLLTELVQSKDAVLEFGSGRSTVWFSQKAKEVTSIEHNKEWFDRVGSDIREKNLENTRVIFTENNDSFTKNVSESICNSTFDVILVDGIRRDECAMLALEKVRSGGLIIIDDSHRYLPSTSSSPCALRPGHENLDFNSHWPEFVDETSKFRQIRTSSGVSDTTIFFT